MEAEAGWGQKGELPDQVAEQVVGAGPKALPQPHCHLDEETAAPGSQRRGTLHLCLLKAGHACTPRGPPQNTRDSGPASSDPAVQAPGLLPQGSFLFLLS